jgi:hypothetical protein
MRRGEEDDIIKLESWELFFKMRISWKIEWKKSQTNCAVRNPSFTCFFTLQWRIWKQSHFSSRDIVDCDIWASLHDTCLSCRDWGHKKYNSKIFFNSTDIVSNVVQVKSSAMKMKTEFLFYFSCLHSHSSRIGVLCCDIEWNLKSSQYQDFNKNLFFKILRQKWQNKIPQM